MTLTETFKALGDPVRREILQLLKKKSMTPGELCAHFPISEPAISRHLGVLRKAGLVRCTRQGKYLRYELSATVLDEIILFSRSLQQSAVRSKENSDEIPSELADSR